MSFSFSSGRIVQSGTDTSLAGLAGLSGVTIDNSGTQTIYTITATRFQNTGTSLLFG